MFRIPVAVLSLALLSFAQYQAGATDVGSISVQATPPVANAYIEDIVPINLNQTGYPYLIILWAVGNGTESVPVQILGYDQTSNSYVDQTAQVIQGPVPQILNPRNFIVTNLNGSGYPSILIANQGLDASPWPGTTNTLLLSTSSGQLFDASSSLPQSLAYSHDVSSGVIAKNGTVGIFVNNIYSAPNTPPYFLVDDFTGAFPDRRNLLPQFVINKFPYPAGYTSSALVDLTGDGLADLVLGQEDSSTEMPSLAFINPGNGNFNDGVLPITPPPIALPKSPLPNTPGLYGNSLLGPTVLDIRPINISSNKYSDLVVTSTTGNYQGYAFQILINDGFRHFTDQTSKRVFGAPSWQTSQTANYWVKRAWVVNVNGVSDIVTESAGDLSVPSQVFLNDGSGHFHLSTSVTGQSFANFAYIGGTPTLIETNYATITLVPFP